jgi:hypothetical protein
MSSLIALMKEAARTSETSVDIQLRTRQYIPEDSELHTRRRENLKSHVPSFLVDIPAVVPSFWYVSNTVFDIHYYQTSLSSG